MAPEDTRDHSERGAAVGDVVELVRRYALQETVGSLRVIGKRLAFGAVGGILVGTGLVLLLLAVLRLLQTETGSFFAGNMSFGPYLCTAVLGVAMLGLAALVMLRTINRDGGRSVR
jgi:hypothetical protein